MKWLLASVLAMGMMGCHEARSARETAAHPTPDWSIDKCRISYKGRLVPLGAGIGEWIGVFGPPSDSSSMFKMSQGWMFYVWDSIGITAGAMGDRDADHLYSVILFLEPGIDEKVYPRAPTRAIQKGLRLDGEFVDTVNFAEKLRNHYEESTERCCPKPLYRRYMIGDSLSLNSSPNLTEGVPKGALSFFLHPLGPKDHLRYATEVQKLDANCAVPGRD